MTRQKPTDDFAVALKQKTGPNAGTVSWTNFKDQKSLGDFLASTAEDGSGKPMSDFFEVEAKGITEAGAEALSRASRPGFSHGIEL